MSIFSMNFAAPLMALQGPRIDGRPQSVPIPTRALVTGMIGAALGITRKQSDVLQRIQDTLRLGVVVQRRGVEIIDYQTADLGKRHMRGPMWSSGTSIVEREGGDTEGTRQQYRPYLADAGMTVVVELVDDAPFTADQILAALDEPKFMLCYGRVSCPPTGRIAGEILPDGSLEQAMSRFEGDVYIPADAVEPVWGDLLVSLAGTRDWGSGRHSGSDVYIRRQRRVSADETA